MEMTHTIRNTLQHCQIGMALYINGPIHKRRLPTAVAPSHKPWHTPCKCFGATLETKDKPSGEMNNSAMVRKKYMTISTHGPASIPDLSSTGMARKSVADG